MAAVGERRITYDARGLAEPFAEAPRIAEIDGERATFDAQDLTTRTINLELRWLLYEEGVKEVVVDNPGASTRSGSGSSPAARSPSNGSLGYFGCGLIDGPEIHVTGPGRLVGLREHDVRRRRRRRQRGLADGAALRGGDVVVKGRVGARSGIDQKGGTIIVARLGRLDDRLHDAARPHHHLRRRRPGPRRLDVRRDDLRRRHGEVARHRLRPGEWTDADTELIERKFSDLRARLAARVPEVRLRQGALQLRLARARRAKLVI